MRYSLALNKSDLRHRLFVVILMLVRITFTIQVGNSSVASITTAQSKTSVSQTFRRQLRQYGMKTLSQNFPLGFTKLERDQVVEALRILTTTLEKSNITYFLYGGSLIGSWRHHDIIPWDDDIDIIVNISDWQRIEQISIPGYTLNRQMLDRYKFYNNEAVPVEKYFWKWPFIDICLFGDNGTHIFDMAPTFKTEYMFRREDVVPLTKRPFAGLHLYAPRNTDKILAQTYDISYCVSKYYDHKRERAVKPEAVTTVACNLLHRLYPFVHRENSSSNIENLLIDDKLIDSVELTKLD